MERVIGPVGGKLLRESPSTGTVFIDSMFPIPVGDGQIIATAQSADNPMFVILRPNGRLELLSAAVETDRIVIDEAQSDLENATVVTAAMTEQLIAVATDSKVVVISHSHRMPQTPTWLLMGRDAVSFLRFTPDRKQLICGHASGRVNTVDLHMGTLAPIPKSNMELVPAAADPKPSDRVRAALCLPQQHVLVVTCNQVQLWSPAGPSMNVKAIKPPSGVGQLRDCLCLRAQLFILCDFAVWHLKHRRRSEKAKLTRCVGSYGWTFNVAGLTVWRTPNAPQTIKV